jgi:hypothetical protein
MKTAKIVVLVASLIPNLLNAQDSIKFSLTQTITNIGANDIVLADFNRDGNLDAFIVNGIWNQPLPSKLMINNGNGNFTFSEQEVGNSKSWSVAAGDINGDGSNDLFITNGDWNIGDSSKVWLNDGHGKFTCSKNNFGKTNGSCSALGDLNGDGSLDIFIANHPYSNGQEGEDEVWINDGKGNFANSGQKLGGSQAARRVKLVDVNGDHYLDAVVLNGGEKNEIWLNDGKGNFYESSSNTGNGENIDLAFGDTNNDGAKDIIIAKGAWGKTPKGIELWINDGKGIFTKSQSVGDNDCYGIALGDLNGDNYLDVVAVNGKDQPNQMFLNDKHGYFYDSKLKIGEGGNKVVVGDLNYDSLLDIIIAGDESTKVYLQTKNK